ncbi:MAG: hypothetical protein IJW94_00675 [Oscillospiraceae bacterium]|nr:hypothetical protein [Oscillospiraceae bacterium]
MEKIKVGYLPLYIKLYDDSDPHLRDPMVRHMNMLVSMLETQGLEIVMADEVCRIAPEFEKAVQKFNDAGVTAVITQHLAYSPSLESIQSLLKLNAPIIVFDTTPDYELIKVANYSERIDPNHGIHGVQDMCNLLKRNGKPYYICAGHALHSEVLSEVVGMCRAAAVAKAYRNAKVGSVGGSFTGMGDFLISDERYRNDIGAEVSYMTTDVVKEYVAKVTDEEVDAEIALDAKKYTVNVNKMEEYRLATKSGLAVRKWMEEKELTACTINFLTLDICGLPKMPFAEGCKILERGKGYAGEGDVLTAGLVGALYSVYPNTTFTEMFCPDWEQDVLLMSHMGESNPNLAQWKPVISDCPFNYNSCGDTVAVYSCIRPGNVSIVNLAPMNDSFTMIICPGKMLDAGLEFGAYRNANQGWFKPGKKLPAFLKEYSMNGGTHHCAMVYDVPVEELKTFGQMMGFDVVVIE